MWPDARLLVEADLEGDSAYLLLDTRCRLDISLSREYTQHRGFPFQRRDEAFVMVRFDTFAALGRSRPHDQACAFGMDVPEPEHSIYAGSLGVLYLNDAMLGVDAAGPVVALSTRSEIRASFPESLCRLPLVHNALDRLPLTQSLTDLEAPAAVPTFLLSTGTERSSISINYVQHQWRKHSLRWKAKRAHRKGGTVPLRLQLPNGDPVHMEAAVESDMPEYIGEVGVRQIDGVLGVDFLRRWMQVFDFPGRELVLFPY